MYDASSSVFSRFVNVRLRNGGLSMPSITTSSWLSARPPPMPPPMPPGMMKLAMPASRWWRPDGPWRSGARSSNSRSRQRPCLEHEVARRVECAPGAEEEQVARVGGADPCAPAKPPVPSEARRMPTASISSMKTMHWPPHLRAMRFAFQAR